MSPTSAVVFVGSKNGASPVDLMTTILAVVRNGFARAMMMSRGVSRCILKIIKRMEVYCDIGVEDGGKKKRVEGHGCRREP